MTQYLNDFPEESTLNKAKRWFAQSLTQSDQFSAYFEPIIQMVLPNWSTDTIRARVLSVRSESDDVYTLIIRPSRSWLSFEAGQHLEITVERNGSLQTRIFSISSSPEYFRKTGLIELSIRIQDQGKITPWMFKHLHGGQLVNLSRARGDFVLDNRSTEPVLMIAGGSGITPFRSMLQQIGSSNTKRDITLLFYVRDSQNELFKDEFEALSRTHEHINIQYLHGDKDGYVCPQHIQQHCPDVQSRLVMICGPTAMIQLARSTVSDMGVDDAQIKFEYFGAAPIDETKLNESDAYVSFAKSGIATESTAANPKSLLVLAEDQGVNAKSGCRVGVCHQCKCTKKSGVVLNTLTGQYSDTGQEDIQLCVSVAVNDVVLDI